ncbi:MAG: 4-hydroxybutyrate CoA-transferase [Bacteroidetes bacterium GWE2_42_24]|nr:MAG: 4-hydroxybutyrate CoA-transferase [Bacteroidetes bacterium GWE2_42_24]OFY30575.1 MAG: 4-hydroxybutyrate CoA-transferase [Bacteroidetes bacterium GWF2_43_11]PKP19364.1 MAG: 4-hydroxybutyrate CoA-transferase [Bacteroidetes bacterium HGW-Bacteroidetes-22]
MYTPVSFNEAVKVIKSNDHIVIHSVACAPHKLINAMVERGQSGAFRNVKIHHLHTEGPAPYAGAEFEGIFQLESFFVGHNVRKDTQAGYADYIPVFLNETQKLIREGIIPVNVAMVQVSPPNKHGWVSLGTSVDATLAAVENAETVIGVINPKVPRAFGDAMIHMSHIDIFCEDDTPLTEAKPGTITETDRAIGRNVAALVEDGATLQMGIGAIPNAVLAELVHHKNLGVHTEMFSDGLLPLVAKGVVNGAEKRIDRGKIVSTFLMGSKNLYDFIDDNPGVLMKDVGYTNSVDIICKNPKVTSINSAIQIDLTGQVCADSIGTKFYSGVGGQIDFIRGAASSDRGKPIIALPSITEKGVSKIAPVLNLGAGVVTTRANIHWVVTEYGAVNLYGKSLQDRAKLLISISHPQHREELEIVAFERFGPHFRFIG